MDFYSIVFYLSILFCVTSPSLYAQERHWYILSQNQNRTGSDRIRSVISDLTASCHSRSRVTQGGVAGVLRKRVAFKLPAVKRGAQRGLQEP